MSSLKTVQRGFALKLCRAYRAVSLNAALVLTGLLSLDLRIREAGALYEAKRGIPREALGDREIERQVDYKELLHPTDRLRISFVTLTDQEELNIENEDEHIFTDGSKIEGQVRAAFTA